MIKSMAARAVVCAAVVVSFATIARAQVKPGDHISAQNAALVKDLVSPGTYFAVTKGMGMEIVAAQRVDWPPPYKIATEQYSSQVRLSEDHRSVLGYVAGQPFPLLDMNDPYVATKIMWDSSFRPIATDDADLRFFECQVTQFNPGGEQNSRIKPSWVMSASTMKSDGRKLNQCRSIRTSRKPTSGGARVLIRSFRPPRVVAAAESATAIGIRTAVTMRGLF